MSKPTNWLSRSPAFKQYLWNHVEQMMPLGSRTAQRTLIDNAVKAGIPKSQIKRLRTRAQFAEGEMSAVEIDTFAKGYALDETRTLLYDAAEHGRVMDAMRIVFPFGEAWKEVLTRWFDPRRGPTGQRGLMFQNYGRPLRRAQQIILAGKSEGFGDVMQDIGAVPEWLGNGEGEGFFFTDQYGEEVFAFPWSHHINNAVIGAPVPTTGRLKGLFFINDVMPGLGPVTQIPVAWLTEQLSLHQPEIAAEIESLLFPYGKPSEFKGPVQFLPSWGKTLVQRFGALTGPWTAGTFARDERTYGNAIKDMATYLMSTGGYGTSGSEQTRLYEDAAQMANRLYIVEMFGKFVLPTVPNGDAILEDKEGRIISLAAYTEEYFDERLDDPANAAQTMLERYGLDTYLALQPRSAAEIYNLPTTTDQDIWLKNHPDVKNDARLTYTLFMPQPRNENDFDYDVYISGFTDQLSGGGRLDIKPEQWIRMGNDLRARAIYRRKKDELGPTYTDEERLVLHNLRRELEAEYYGFNSAGGIETPTTDQMVRDLYLAIQNDSIAQTDAGRGAIAYLAYRDKVIAQIDEHNESESEVTTIRNSMWRRNRNWLRNKAREIAEQHPDFMLVWNEVFRRELEQD